MKKARDRSIICIEMIMRIAEALPFCLLTHIATPAFAEVCGSEWDASHCYVFFSTARLIENLDLTLLESQAYTAFGSTIGDTTFLTEADVERNQPLAQVEWYLTAEANGQNWVGLESDRTRSLLSDFSKDFAAEISSAACGYVSGMGTVPKPEFLFLRAGGVISLEVKLAVTDIDGKPGGYQTIATATIDNCEAP
ncbi:MAG: hypothetical protein ACRC6I_14620 [Paracoccaceae bacterium]